MSTSASCVRILNNRKKLLNSGHKFEVETCDQVTNGSAALGHVTTVLTSDWLSRGLAFSCHKSVFIWDFENIDTSTSAFCGTMTRI